MTRKNYYELSKFPGLRIEDIIKKWSIDGAALYDEDVHGVFSADELWKYREYTWSRESAGGRQVKGRAGEIYTDKWAFLPDDDARVGEDKWDAFASKLKASSWSSRDPLLLIVGRNGVAKVGEGNHRLALARQIGLKAIPVRFLFWEKVELDSASNR